MIATFIMNGSWIELPVSSGMEREKLEDRITEKSAAIDGYGSLYDSLCVTADIDNAGPVLISDYTESHQDNDGNRADYIELNPGGELQLPWNRQVQALNRPLVMGQAGDVVKVVAR